MTKGTSGTFDVRLLDLGNWEAFTPKTPANIALAAIHGLEEVTNGEVNSQLEIVFDGYHALLRALARYLNLPIYVSKDRANYQYTHPTKETYFEKELTKRRQEGFQICFRYVWALENIQITLSRLETSWRIPSEDNQFGPKPIKKWDVLDTA